MALEGAVPETEAIAVRMTELRADDSSDDGKCEHQRTTAVEEKSQLCHREHLLP